MIHESRETCRGRWRTTPLPHGSCRAAGYQGAWQGPWRSRESPAWRTGPAIARGIADAASRRLMAYHIGYDEVLERDGDHAEDRPHFRAFAPAPACGLVAGPGCRRQEQAETGVVKGRALARWRTPTSTPTGRGGPAGPAFATSRPAARSEFSLALPAGKYLLVLRKRARGSPSPVATATTAARSSADHGARGEAITRDIVARRRSREQESPALSRIPRRPASPAHHRQRRQARPGARSRLPARTDVERPKYVSEGSGVDGSYSLFFPEGAPTTWPREQVRRPPKIGELYGRYERRDDRALGGLCQGREILKNVDITMHKIW